jgi:signal transduction histidine kinase
VRYARALAYLVTGIPVGAVALVALLAMLTIGLPTVFIPCGIPVFLALPVAVLERRRIRIVDPTPVPSPYMRTRGIIARYGDPATWRDLGYTILLSTMLWMLDLVIVFMALLLPASLLAAPLIQAITGEVKVIKLVLVTTPAGAWACLAIGVAWLYGAAVVIPFYADSRAAFARAMLTSDGVQELTRSRARLVDGFEAERRRIERDLHDGAQQRLVSLGMTLGIARLAEPAEVPGLVDEAHRQAQLALDELQELIRGIHPRILVDRGLPAAIAELADRCPVPVRIDLDIDPDHRPPPSVETTAYFVVSEALTNIAKHSGATKASITGRRRPDRLELEIEDDGTGGADPTTGSGLTGLGDRVAVGNGRLTLKSPVGGPTVIRVDLPCV